MSRQLLQEDAVGDSVKGFTKAQMDNIHSLSLIHLVSHPVIEGDQAVQAGPTFPAPMLAGTDALVVLHVPSEFCQHEQLHNLPWYRGQADRSVVPQILLLAHLVDGWFVCILFIL